MSVILVLALSILMQFSAALYSLILLRHFGGRSFSDDDSS